MIKKAARPVRASYLCLDSGIAAIGNKGASVHLRSICGALRQEGAYISLYCTRAVTDAKLVRKFANHYTEFRMPDSLRRLQRELRDYYGPDLRVPAEIRQALINRAVQPELATAWRREKIQVVLERLSLMGVAGVRACAETGDCHILEVNALLSDEARAFRSLSDYDSARRAEDEVLHQTRHIFCVSAELRNMILQRGVTPDKVEVLPNGYDTHLFRPRSGASVRKKLGLQDHFVIGMVGSLKPWHGVGLLLEAMKSWSLRQKVALLIIGEGPESVRISEFCSSNPRLKIVTTGAMPQNQIPPYIAAFDVGVAPYEPASDFYFSPLKMYEYLAMGKPVIASDQGQAAQIVEHGKNGLLVPAGNVEEFVLAVERLKKSTALRERLAKNARPSVANRTWNRNARRILAVARKLCHES